jgi:hypothetical protein
MAYCGVSLLRAARRLLVGFVVAKLSVFISCEPPEVVAAIKSLSVLPAVDRAVAEAEFIIFVGTLFLKKAVARAEYDRIYRKRKRVRS